MYMQPIFHPITLECDINRLMTLTQSPTRKALAEALGTSTRTLKTFEAGKVSRTLQLATKGLVSECERTIEVTARRWFDRTYGNTYFSCSVWLDDVKVCSTDFTYGYGDYYVQWALEQLNKSGHIETTHQSDLFDMHNIKVIANHSDVNRKKDL